MNLNAFHFKSNSLDANFTKALYIVTTECLVLLYYVKTFVFWIENEQFIKAYNRLTSNPYLLCQHFSH